MFRNDPILIVTIVIHFVCSGQKIDAASEQDWYSPASSNQPFVHEKVLDTEYEWISSPMRAEIQRFSDDTAESFASRINDLCGKKPTHDQVKEIVMGILTPSDTPTYLNILPPECSAKITANVPYLLIDPYYRVLAGFQNWKGNDAYLEAILRDPTKKRLYNLSRLKNLPSDRPNIYGITPLLAACRYGRYFEAKRILKKPKISYERSDPLGRTAMHLVAQYCSDPKMMECLMQRGKFNVNSQDAHGNTPLHLAFLHLLHGDHQSIVSQDGESSTTGSSKLLNPADSILEYLVRYSKDLDPNIENEDDDTVLHLATDKLDSLLLEVRDDLDYALDLLLTLPFNDVDELFKKAFDKDNHPPRDQYSIGKLTVPFLKNAGTNITDQKWNINEDTYLHIACRNRELLAVKAMMKHPGAPVNSVNRFGRTPLHVAYEANEYRDFVLTGPTISWGYDVAQPISTTQASIIEALLGNINTDPNMVIDKDALIHMACRKHDYGTVRMLLIHKRTNVNMRGRDGKTPIEIAFDLEDLRLINQQILRKHSELHLDNPSQSILGLLLQHDRVVPDIKIGSERNTLLHYACEKPNLVAIKLLLNNRNTDVNQPNAFSKTALYVAYQYDNQRTSYSPRIGDLTKMLLGCPRVDASELINDAGDTLLHIACRTGDSKAIQILLSLQSTNLNARNAATETPFQIAYKFDQEHKDHRAKSHELYIGPLTKRLLSDPRTDCNVPIDEDGNTIMHILANFHCLELDKRQEVVDLMNQILASQVNPNIENKAGLTPLQYAYKNEGFDLLTSSCPGVLRALLQDERTNPNVPIGKHGGTILHLACLQTELEAVRLLLNHPNIDLMVQDGQGTIPFELALEVKNKDHSLDSKEIVNEIFQAGDRRLNEEGKAFLAEALMNDIRAKESELSKRKKSLLYKLTH